MTDPEIFDVRTFQTKFGMITANHPQHLTKRKLLERIACMTEELTEFTEAVEAQDMAEMADALVDLVYFAKGTAAQLGLDHIWHLLWADVQRANMTKVRGVGKRGQQVDCVKPEGWVPPQTMAILINGGYDATRYMRDGQICEDLCVDDKGDE